MKSLDLIIVGAGIAGVNAAVYAKRSGLTFKIFESKAIGGQLFYMERIDNYLGLKLGTKGRELARSLADSLSGLNIPIESEQVKEVKQQEGVFQVLTNKGQYRSKAVILATGSSFRKLGLTNEVKLTGKGVSYCAVCDGFFFKGKNVAVVGGGNTAVEEALYLSSFAKTVTLIHRRSKLRALEYLSKNLTKKDNVNIIYNHTIKEILGQQQLKGLIIEEVDKGNPRELPLDGLFVAIGSSPNTEICRQLVSTDEKGFITTDSKMKTSNDLVWACGDCRRRPLRQLITAASEGAIASIEVYKKVRQSYLSV
ncbi:MAG: FAD-dependent oxidoreductase [Candidatus Omnitrophica bacterium]|nr:FAD-dependent oxidoreductase [Candidatus Omnitrophota bacterium]MCF7877380.1 FAD-dependent oxidoreductase [Candidatus Omnitrophota bacterium]MCF7878834.1 FAD-dependent oxidoreductase [Candidatus Omnitrophota bacterium]MCF7893103.1 FAD-dependent oxidoreductase [Candidatus Omnitrophota bacterium]